MPPVLDAVTINQLRAFVAVCEAESFSGAATRLRRAQSAISHAIAALETALDVQLFERDARRATLTPGGRNLLPDARAVITRTEEMKTRARGIAISGVPEISLAVDVYFPRRRLVAGLKQLQDETPMVVVGLRITTMQEGEAMVLDGRCSMAICVDDVPELDPDAIERHWLGETRMVTVCAPTHPLAHAGGPAPKDEFRRYVQLVVTDYQPAAERSLMSVAGERRWRMNDLSAKLDFLRGGLGWGHMPEDHVADDLALGRLVMIERRGWHIGPLTLMIARRRGLEPKAAEARLVDLLSNTTNE